MTTKFYTQFDRFDFEQQIMECWNVTTDIRVVSEYLLDAPASTNSMPNRYASFTKHNRSCHCDQAILFQRVSVEGLSD